MITEEAPKSPDLAPELEDFRVVSFDAFAKVAGFSPSTLRREIKAGRGPAVVRMSTRRVGIQLGEGRRWLKSREVA